MGSKEVLANKLKDWRKVRGMSQEELALTAGISSKQLGKIERCKAGATVTTLDKLAKAMGVTASELLVNEAEG